MDNVICNQLFCQMENGFPVSPFRTAGSADYEALRGSSGRRLYCWLTSSSQSLQTSLRIILDSTMNYISSLNFDKVYDILEDVEKRDLLHSLIKKIELNKGDTIEERTLESIEFRWRR